MIPNFRSWMRMGGGKESGIGKYKVEYIVSLYVYIILKFAWLCVQIVFFASKFLNAICQWINIIPIMPIIHYDMDNVQCIQKEGKPSTLSRNNSPYICQYGKYTISFINFHDKVELGYRRACDVTPYAKITTTRIHIKNSKSVNWNIKGWHYKWPSSSKTNENC